VLEFAQAPCPVGLATGQGSPLALSTPLRATFLQVKGAGDTMIRRVLAGRAPPRGGRDLL